VSAALPETTPKVSPLYDPRVRSYFFQTLLIVVVGYLLYSAATNAIDNLRAAKIATGLGFWNTQAGFEVSQSLIPFSALSSYGQAFWVGLLNTLLVGFIGVFFATILGFAVGISRLSKNWIIAQMAMIYVEVIRNLPLLLQLFFWYNAVLKPLPVPKDSLSFGGGIFINNRGLFLPEPIFGAGSWLIWVCLAVGGVASLFIRSWAKKRQEATGEQFPTGLVATGLILGLPVLGYLLAGMPITLNYPSLKGFNFSGGMQVIPELFALILGLVTYTAGFIAEIVRAGIMAVSKGQTEASESLGIKHKHTLNLVVIPQAMRVIIPPLTSQYLNLVKNSTLGVAIGYPDLVQIFAGTVLNQTGQAIEVIGITMAVYLAISLITSFIMNIYNNKMKIVER
jgi:general L-amino acid transport system permease protein